MRDVQVGRALLRIALVLLVVLFALGLVVRRSNATETGGPIVTASLFAANPFSLARTALASRVVEGVVLESFSAGAYRYVHVVDARGRDQWVVGLGLEARRGAYVTYPLIATSNDFQSPALGRRFERLHFVVSSFVP